MSKKLRQLIYAPIVWLMIIPLFILDIFITIYNHLAFRLLKITKVKRKQHIKIDRHKIKSLRLIKKLNCAYCGYANGLISYTTEIAARTEKYWCPIKHKKTKGFIEPKHHKKFKKYPKEE